MKKLSVFLLALICAGLAQAQSADKVWSFGIEGGGEQFKGDYGNGFYKQDHGLYGFGGLSVYHYLAPHFDIGLLATVGKIGYKDNGVSKFESDIYQFNANVRFSFFKADKVILRPFLLLGFGDFYINGTNHYAYNAGDILSLPDFGAGLMCKITPSISLKLQEMVLYPVRPATDNLKQDGYLQHSVGLVFNMGRKKDADGDRVADSKDKCPETPSGVKTDATGCPLDTDGDGIADYLDGCPDVKGTAAAKGCPDSDADGVADKDDKCANTPTAVAVDASGCPLDRDGDGIADYLDKCPDAKGTSANGGCPDSDGDGVPDNTDKCPGTPANVAVTADGCPVDKDGDGVPDYMDTCPNEKGTMANKGCPEVKAEVKEIFRKALEGIEFEVAKDVIQKHSLPILKQVVTVMKENPSYNLQINGYTDNQGKAEANKLLSEKRAAAVKKYLENNGIDAKRLNSAGFGGANPRGDNKTAAGRKLNRRVEFVVKF